MDPLLRKQNHELYWLMEDPDHVVFDWDLMDIRVQTIGSFLEYEACGTADVELVFDEEARRYSTVSGESAQEVICKP